AGLEARDFTDAAWQAKATDEQIIKQITNGTPDKMMPFKEKLSNDEIKALVPVVRSFGKK
ncbi:MAG TPA: c-type cytochrome, partial [Candidatus Brocadiaceae bacterium]